MGTDVSTWIWPKPADKQCFRGRTLGWPRAKIGALFFFGLLPLHHISWKGGKRAENSVRHSVLFWGTPYRQIYWGKSDQGGYRLNCIICSWIFWPKILGSQVGCLPSSPQATSPTCRNGCEVSHPELPSAIIFYFGTMHTHTWTLLIYQLVPCIYLRRNERHK
jgi:hypothetical protein